ncbi:hypothetical protein SHIRM173S_08754 [Streptomyces hirsutus]
MIGRSLTMALRVARACSASAAEETESTVIEALPTG